MLHKRLFAIPFFFLYLAIIIWAIINNTYYPQSIILILVFLVTNIPFFVFYFMERGNRALRLELRSKSVALNLEHQRWDSLLGLLPQMVFECRSNDHAEILFVNNFGLKFLGYQNFDELRGKTIFDIIDKLEKKKILQDFDKVIKNQTNTINEYICIRKDGSRFPAALYSAPVFNEQKGVVGVRGVLIDLTEISKFKEIVERLKSLDKIKDDFLNIAAHELKTPITSILMLAELLKIRSKQLNCREAIGQIDVILNETNRLRKIVDQILTVTRFENKQSFYKDEVFDFSMALKEFTVVLKSLVEGRGMKIAFNISNVPAPVVGNRDKIVEVLSNFVDNAIKYGKAGQTIEVNSSIVDNTVLVEVIDQGEGIPDNKLKNMFLKFGQLENTFHRKQEGIGLGLYICRLIIESHSGHIGVRSKINGGSTFYFTLPLNK